MMSKLKTAGSLVMRIALVSDIHGNLPALEAVAADIRRRGADAVYALGDLLSGPLAARDTAHWLMASGWPCLAGNHERQLLSADPAEREASDRSALAELDAVSLAWLSTLPPTLRPSPDILLCHGTPLSDCHYLLETVDGGGIRLANGDEIAVRLAGETASLIACGHSHLPRALEEAGVTLVNPGSVGLPAYADTTPMYHRVENGSPDARYALVERLDGRWHVDLVSVPYDWRPMAVLAARNGRAEWARALESGRV